MNADMVTGWKPKSVTPFQVPLHFESRYDPLIEELISLKCNSLVYLGFRPIDSLVMHS